MSEIPFTEKYRPKSLSEVSGQIDMIKLLNEFISQKKLPHMLFYGPPGSGKTSTIMALCRDMFGEHYKSMTLELNGSDDRGINVIRSQVKNFARLKNVLMVDFPKIIILDEADSLTNDAQFALRRVIEKYTSNVRFCIICNYLNKVIPALQSRCVMFRFSNITLEDSKRKVREIKKIENLFLKIKDIDRICQLADGDFRKILHFLQQRNFSEENIISYFYGVSVSDFHELEQILIKKLKFPDAHAKIQDLVNNSRISLTTLIKVFSSLGIKHKDYAFCRRLGDLESKYYLSNHTLPEVFIIVLCSIFESL